MSQRFVPLSYIGLQPDVTFERPSQPPYLSHHDDPALDAMTDFHFVDPVTVAPATPIDEALDKMKRTGVRSLLVTGPGQTIAGMVTGITVTLLYVFQHKGIMFVPGTEFLGDREPNWFLGIEPNAFGAVGALVNFAVTFAVSRFTAPPPGEVQELVENIRVPAGASVVHGH